MMRAEWHVTFSQPLTILHFLSDKPWLSLESESSRTGWKTYFSPPWTRCELSFVLKGVIKILEAQGSVVKASTLPCSICGLSTQHAWRSSLVNWVPCDGEPFCAATVHLTAAPARVGYTVNTHTRSAECSIGDMACVQFIHLSAEAAYWRSPRVASCYENTGKATSCVEQCQRSCKVCSNPSSGWSVSCWGLGPATVSVASQTLTKALFSWQVFMHSPLARGNPVVLPFLDSVPGCQPSRSPPALQMLAKPPAAGSVKCFSPGICDQSLTKVSLNISLQLARLPIHLEIEQTAKIKRHAVSLLPKAFQCLQSLLHREGPQIPYNHPIVLPQSLPDHTP